MNRPTISALLGALLFLLAPGISQADVDLPQLFSDHMVLQRHRPIPVWGQADPGQRVTVSIDGESRSTTASDDGHWRVDLPAMKAGGPYQITVEGNDRTVIDDVLVGEVWICSGQSNMEWPLRKTREAKQQNAVEQADFDRIRLFQLPRMKSKQPLDRIKETVQWQLTHPDVARDFSAVGYFFGRRLYRALKRGNRGSSDVPIGLIHTSWGGTTAEAWTSRQALNARPELRGNLSQHGNRTPSGLYNAMIHPLIPYGIQGTIWYQGEANISKPYTYRTLLPTMIRDWRDRWGQGDFPFYFVQLAPHKYGNRGSLPLFWETQLLVHKLLPRTGIAVINDLVKNPEDIHPRTKQPVGKRLARWALHQVYDRDTVPSGPLFEGVLIRDGRATVYFQHTGDGLKTRPDSTLSQFQIAGPDRTFHPADAEIDGDTVIVRSDQVQNPVAVRYAWNETAKANLLNSEGLPASSFRTDGWALEK